MVPVPDRLAAVFEFVPDIADDAAKVSEFADNASRKSNYGRALVMDMFRRSNTIMVRDTPPVNDKDDE